MQGGPPIDNGINQEGNPVSATSVGEELFTTEQQGDTVLYKVDGNTVAVAMPTDSFLPSAWHVTVFDPFGGELAGAGGVSENSARKLAKLFARTAARAVAR